MYFGLSNVCIRSIEKNTNCVAESTPATCDASGAIADDTVIAQPRVTVSRAAACGCLPTSYKFPLHNVRQGLLTCVNNGQPLKTKDRSELLEAIYVDVSRFTLYVSLLLICM